MSSKEQLKDYVSGLKNEIRILYSQVDAKSRENLILTYEINRLKKVCRDNTAILLALEVVVMKTKRWYQIFIKWPF